LGKKVERQVEPYNEQKVRWHRELVRPRKNQNFVLVFARAFLFNKYMAIKPICNKCKKELKEFGGILLSPPNKDNRVKKYHLCKTCFNKIEQEIK